MINLEYIYIFLELFRFKMTTMHTVLHYLWGFFYFIIKLVSCSDSVPINVRGGVNTYASYVRMSTFAFTFACCFLTSHVQ